VTPVTELPVDDASSVLARSPAKVIAVTAGNSTTFSIESGPPRAIEGTYAQWFLGRIAPSRPDGVDRQLIIGLRGVAKELVAKEVLERWGDHLRPQQGPLQEVHLAVQPTPRSPDTRTGLPK
jgi:hypothetical protein